MGKTLENVVITIYDENYPAQKLIELWLREDTHLNYTKLEQVKDILIELNINVPEELSSRLETSDHKKRKKGEKINTSDKNMRDLGIYLSKWSGSLKHGESEKFIADRAEEWGLEDVQHLGERIRKVGKFFEQDLDPNYINREYIYLIDKVNNRKEKPLTGQRAERYALRKIAKNLHTTQAKIRKLLQ